MPAFFQSPMHNLKEISFVPSARTAAEHTESVVKRAQRSDRHIERKTSLGFPGDTWQSDIEEMKAIMKVEHRN